MWASLVLGPYFSSLFGSCIQSGLHFALWFAELGAMIPFSWQLTIKLMLLLLELVPLAFTVALFVQWVKLKSSQFKDKKLTDLMWSILVDSSCPPDFHSDMTMLAWVILRVPCLCLAVLASLFFSSTFLFWPWPTAFLLLMCSLCYFMVTTAVILALPQH